MNNLELKKLKRLIIPVLGFAYSDSQTILIPFNEI